MSLGLCHDPVWRAGIFLSDLQPGSGKRGRGSQWVPGSIREGFTEEVKFELDSDR